MKYFSPEHRKNISLAKTGKARPDMLGDKNPAKRKGIGRKISQKLKGRIIGKNWRKRMSEAKIESYKNGAKIGFRLMWERYPNINRGKNNHNWKGDEVSYRSLHKWVQTYLGKPDKCDDCGKSGLKGRQIHWANKSGEYKRKLSDWIRLCIKCHGAYDKKNNSRKHKHI